jgi:molybdopterin/thiamine biosynthesis adenylyltransferase
MSLYQRQEKLDLNVDQSVTVVGCGGIGFWVAKFLAMSGIEKLFLFDNDVIEEHNLNRLDLPYKTIGKNKADVVKILINALRIECTVIAMPFKFNEGHKPNTDWLIDCTDNYESQVTNQRIAKDQGMKYVKAGYDGEDFSIHNSVAEWGEAEDGYRVVPSWVVPAVMVASLTVAKILKYDGYEVVSNIRGAFFAPRRS